MALRTLRMLAALSIAACALPAQAIPVRMQFGGEITNTFGLSGIFAGDQWALDVSYDTGASDLAPEAGLGLYEYRPLSMQIGARSLTPDDSTSLINVSENFEFAPVGVFWNGLVMTGTLGNDFGAPAPQFFVQMAEVCFATPCDPGFGSTALPASGEDFLSTIDALIAGGANVFDLVILARSGAGQVNGIAQGTLTSWRSVAVSEPGAALWWGIALVAAVWLIRRRGVTESSREPAA
jgi:MYXO-CTERM domain-containing protein